MNRKDLNTTHQIFVKRISHFSIKQWIVFWIVGLGLMWFALCLPSPLFNDPTCTVLTDNQGKLLAARIANDGQWRFPYNDSVPDKFKKAIVVFEDQYFYYHPGINPFSIFRAMGQNLKAKKVVSGGSTLSAQVIRISRKGKGRTIVQKLIEYILAVRLELRCSKDEILAFYASNAPFGGNVVGLDAASWRYYGRPPDKLSWGETATLAVLPNAPSLIYPGKNHAILLAKRNRLLDKLWQHHDLDSLSCELAKLEPLPGKPVPLPQLTPHLLTRVFNEGNDGKRIRTTIDRNIQNDAARIVDKHYKVLSQNGILNAAALVIDVETGNALAYVGNTSSEDSLSGNQVDIITAPRSTGSTLKPFLFALMQKDGLILPTTLVPDIPTQITGYAPKNFNKDFDGAVHANNALARSLNIPAVRMLQQYGVERFHEHLKDLNFSTITQPADHYGLSLILGGAETTLWDLVSAYTSMARVLNHFNRNNSKYEKTDYHPANFYASHSSPVSAALQENDLFGAGAIWLTFEALTDMNRPDEEANWKLFTSSKRITWKTGTSFGHRDAWAVGVTPRFVVGIWVGNADGEGRPGMTGASTAAPIMFDIFNQLPETGWFNTPYDDLVKARICKKSGYKASSFCEETDSVYITSAGLRSRVCPYHQLVHLDKTGKFQVNSDCYPVSDMVNQSWFILPPVMEWYYKSKDPFYKPLPPFLPQCETGQVHNMEIIYPRAGTKIFIPKGFNSEQQKTVFKVVHRIPGMTIYWHLDQEYLGSTTTLHQMEIYAPEGIHTLTLVDENGETQNCRFEVLGK